MTSITIALDDKTGELEISITAKAGMFKKHDLSGLIGKVLEKALPEQKEG